MPSIDRLDSSLAIGPLLSVVALCLLVMSPARAQVDVKVGFKEGGNFATLGGNDGKLATAASQSAGPLDRRPGLIIGALVELDPSGPIGVQSELLWIWKGAKVAVGDVQATTKVNYLEMPILAKYQTPLAVGPVKTHLLAGPTLALATQAQRELTTTSAEGETRLVDQTDLTDPTRMLEFGLAGGAEIAYQFTDRAGLTLGVRYRRGLTRVFGSNAGNQGSAPDAWHEGVAISLGFVYSSGWSF